MKTILLDAWNTFVTENGINNPLNLILENYKTPKIIVTNANQEECLNYGIINMPYEVFSLAHKPNKTDSNYFIQLFQKFDLNAENVIYIEHNREAIEAAKSLNIKTFHFNKSENLNKLIKFLDSNL